MIRIFVVDDHELIRRGIRDLLAAEDDLELVGEADSAEAALEGVSAASPDVAILDVRLPDGDGMEVCREIRSTNPSIRTLIFTSFADDDAMLQAMLAGASGFVLKGAEGTDLVAGIRAAAAGQSLVNPALTRKLMSRLTSVTSGGDGKTGLTEQEARVLDLIGEGMTNREIAARLFLAEKTVKNYVSNVLAKLGMAHRTQAALYAARRQWGKKEA